MAEKIQSCSCCGTEGKDNEDKCSYCGFELKTVQQNEHRITITETITGITWLAGIIAFISIWTGSYGWFTFTAISIAFTSGILMKPWVMLLKENKERLISFREMMMLAFRLFILCLGLSSSYMIFASPMYDLFWSYWGFLASLCLWGIISLIERKKKEKKEEEGEKDSKKILKNLKRASYIIITIALPLLNLYQIHIPKQTVLLQDLVIPSKISVYEIDELEETNRRGILGYRQEINYSIEKHTILKNMITEMEGTTVENLRYFHELNYSKMKKLEMPYYYLDFTYQGGGNYPQIIEREDTIDTANYIKRLIIYPNRRAYIELYTRGKRIIETFPINLSDSGLESLGIFDL